MKRRTTAVIGAALVVGASGIFVATTMTPHQSAKAFGMTVFDPSNYAQNLLTAARSLQQINNQIQALQNQATMLTNMARNLSRIDFPQLQQMTMTMQRIDQLMGRAQGIGFQLDEAEFSLSRLFPDAYDQAMTSNDRVIAARSRLDASRAAFRQSMAVQSGIVASVHDDAATLQAIIGRSQSAEGAVQATQATNQLLALSAKQQFQIQQMIAAQYRAQSLEQARRAQSEAEAKSAMRRFLGSGAAYTPD